MGTEKKTGTFLGNLRRTTAVRVAFRASQQQFAFICGIRKTTLITITDRPTINHRTFHRRYAEFAIVQRDGDKTRERRGRKRDEEE